MFGFNPDFQTGKAKITQIRLSVLLTNNTLLSLTEENVLLGGFVRDSSTTVDDQFTIGAAVTGKLTVNIDNTEDTFSRYDFRGAIITASLGGQLTDGTYQLVQVGIYTVDEYIYDGANITLTAYDNLYKFDTPCSGTAVVFPKTVTELVDIACLTAGVTLANLSIPNGSYSVAQQPRQWDTMTWHDVIAYCAQIACCYVKILPNGKLYFSWYETSFFNSLQIDGGTFSTTTTPYSDGGILDGGDFDYNDSVVYDGGIFGDRDNTHILHSINEITIDTDDVLISGVSVTLAATDNINATSTTKDYTKTLGTSGYIIRIGNNPLIETTQNADTVCTYIYNYIVGMRFRSLSAMVTENPEIEAGDNAIVIDRADNTFICFMSRVTYTTGAATSISCDAESPMMNLKARYSEAEKTRALAERTYELAVSDAEEAMEMVISAYATTMGLYQYTESDGQGGTIYVYGNKNTLAASDIRWKFTAGAFMVSSDYGVTWNGAITSSGIAVLQEIYAVKVNADNILAGTMTIGGTSGNQNGALIIKDANGNLIVQLDKYGAQFLNNTFTVDSDNFKVYSDGEIIASKGTIAGLSFINDSYGGRIYTENKTTPLSRTKGLCLSENGLGIGSDNNNTGSGAIIYGSNSSRFEMELYSYHTDEYANGIFHIENYAYNYTPFMVNNYHTEIENTVLINPNYRCPQYSYYSDITAVFMVYGNTVVHGNLYVSTTGGGGGLYSASLTCTGPKSRSVKTTGYDDRKLYCYEMAEPVFGDFGEGIIGDDGYCYVDIDPIFSETIVGSQYQVFLQPYSESNVYVIERNSLYFVVKGDIGTSFGWEIKARQKDLAMTRLEPTDNDNNDRCNDLTSDLDYVHSYDESVINAFMEV